MHLLRLHHPIGEGDFGVWAMDSFALTVADVCIRAISHSCHCGLCCIPKRCLIAEWESPLAFGRWLCYGWPLVRPCFNHLPQVTRVLVFGDVDL